MVESPRRSLPLPPHRARRCTLNAALHRIVAAIVMIAAVSGGMAQQRDSASLRFGPLFEWSALATAPASLPMHAGGEGCGNYTSGSWNALRFGLGIELPDGPFGTTLGLDALYARTRVSMAGSPIAGQEVIDPLTYQPLSFAREFRLRATLESFDLRFNPMVPIAAGFRAGVGVGLGLQVHATFDATDNIVDSNSWADGERSRPSSDAFIPTRATWVPRVVARIDFARPIPGLGALARISVVGDLCLASMIQEAAWKPRSLSADFAMLFDPFPRRPLPPPVPRDTIRLADTVVQPPPRRLPGLVAGIAVEGLDEENRPQSSAVVRVGEVIVRNNIPLLSALYFDAASDTIAPRYSQLSPASARQFGYASVAELQALEMSHHLLDLIGFRLRQHRPARITLYGSASNDEPAELALRRAVRIRDYLTGIWGVARSRIDVRSGPGSLQRSDDDTEDGRAENRRVTMTSTEPDLLGPVTTERIVRDFNPPQLRLTPSMTAEAGVADWNIRIHQGSTQLASYSRADADAGRTALTWRLDDRRIDSSLGTLVAELTVVDSAGQVSSARDSIAMQLVRDSTIVNGAVERRGAAERLNHALVAFGYRSATGDHNHDLWLRDVAEQINPYAHVRITGYTDRIGDDAYNVELSRARAAYVADRLRAALAQRGMRSVSIEVVAGGVDTERFPNDLPEGRVLTRGVTIVVDQRSAADGRP